MTVRPAIDKDVNAVYGFINLLENTVFDFDVFTVMYIHNLKLQDNIYLVAEDDKGIVRGFLSCHGQILLHHLDKVFEIQELFVEEAYRSKKVGQLLLEHLEKILKLRGHIFLEVASSIRRTNAHRFYMRNGFEQSHFRFTKKL
jgi:PhnO protein